MNLELLLSNHDKKCLSCVRNQQLRAAEAVPRILGVEDEDRYAGEHHRVRRSTTCPPSIVRDNTKCVLCRRCVAACSKVQNVGVIGPIKPRLQHP